MPNNPGKYLPNFNEQSGFSLVEIIIVLLIVAIISVLALMSFKSPAKYLADTEAYQINDLLSEARQRSLTQRETIRVEFDQTKNVVRLIAENAPAAASDDKVIRTLTLSDQKQVVVGATPKNISAAPVEMSLTPALSFKKSTYPISNGDMVATLRFVRTGKVLDAGSNPIGDNSAVTGATIYVWMPGQPTTDGSIIRSITVQGTSGITHYLKCPVVNGKCTGWES